MIRPILISSFIILLFAVATFAQSPSCVEGEFARGNFSLTPSEETKEEFYEIENKYCAEVKNNSELLAIYGFARHSKLGQIVRVYKDKVTYTVYADTLWFKERTLTKSEYSKFNDLLTKIKPHTLEPVYERCTDMCVRSEFLSIDQNVKHRFSFFGYYRFPNQIIELGILFGEWQKVGNFKVQYYPQDNVKNLKLLFADNIWSAVTVLKKDGDLQILVRDISKSREDFQKASDHLENTKVDLGKEAYEGKIKRFDNYDKINYAHYFWHKVKNGKLLEKVSAPADYPYFYDLEKRWKTSANGYRFLYICDSSNAKCALVKVDKFNAVTVIREGFYYHHYNVVSPDGKWLVTVRLKNERDNVGDLVRINTITGEEHLVQKEVSSKTSAYTDFIALDYVKAHDKFLILRVKRRGLAENSEVTHLLLDAETGSYEPIKGDFAPYSSSNNKPLQPTSDPNSFWIAKYDYKEKITKFGIYDTKTFTYKPLAEWSGIKFDSDTMWVSEKDKKIYFVYDGHLLGLPLPNIQ